MRTECDCDCSCSCLFFCFLFWLYEQGYFLSNVKNADQTDKLCCCQTCAWRRGSAGVWTPRGQENRIFMVFLKILPKIEKFALNRENLVSFGVWTPRFCLLQRMVVAVVVVIVAPYEK